MKRFLSVMLSFLMVLLLCACNSSAHTPETITRNGMDFLVHTQENIISDGIHTYYYTL